MNEKYNTLSLVELKAIVKAQGIKNTSSMRKAQLVQILCDLEEQQNRQNEKENGQGDAKAAAVDVQEKAQEPAPDTSVSPEVPRDRSTSSSAPQERRGSSAPYEKTNGTYEKANGTYEKAPAARERSAGTAYEKRTAPSAAGTAPVHPAPAPAHTASAPAESRERSYRPARSVRTETGHRGDDYHMEPALEELDSGNMAHGILEVMPDGFGFIRCENYLPGDNDIYVSPAQIRRFNLKTGDIIEGNIKIKLPTEKFSALLFVRAVNGFHPSEASRRKNFEDMTPIFPNSRIFLETERASVPMRIVDLVSPIGKGQRGMIVAPPKTGKTTLLKQIAKSVHSNYPDMNKIILLIDERPEEVTDIKEYIEGDNVEVIYSTFDELPEHHKRVSEMVLERAKRLVEHKKDVVILLDSITRLARAYNLTVPPSGRTLSGGLDPAALHMPKKFFGAARNMREGGSLTVLATALVETGSKMDDVVYEEFKGTGNMELVLDRRLSEKRIFPAIDIARSGTRREELLLNREELEATYLMRKALSGMKSDEALERIIEMFMRTRSNKDFIAAIKRTKLVQ